MPQTKFQKEPGPNQQRRQVVKISETKAAFNRTKSFRAGKTRETNAGEPVKKMIQIRNCEKAKSRPRFIVPWRCAGKRWQNLAKWISNPAI
jgi:hypothetical protein